MRAFESSTLTALVSPLMHFSFAGLCSAEQSSASLGLTTSGDCSEEEADASSAHLHSSSYDVVLGSKRQRSKRGNAGQDMNEAKHFLTGQFRCACSYICALMNQNDVAYSRWCILSAVACEVPAVPGCTVKDRAVNARFMAEAAWADARAKVEGASLPFSMSMIVQVVPTSRYQPQGQSTAWQPSY